MFRQPRRLTALVLAGLLVAGCSGGGSTTKSSVDSSDTGGGRSTAAADEKGDWTVFAYVNGDNNLEGDAVKDIEQMKRAKGTKFIVLVDRGPGYSSDRIPGVGDFSDSRLLQISDGEVKVLDKPGELNMGDPSTLRKFLTSNLKEHASDHNALVLWDHGGAWLGVSWDDSSDGDNLQLPEVDEALKEGLAGLDRPLDLIGFDACLMSTYEVALQLAPHADYMVASEEVEPGGGWDWSKLSTQGGATTRQLGERIIDGFTAESKAQGYQDTTLALLDLSAMDKVEGAVEKMEKAMRGADARKVPGRIGAGRTAAISFGKDPNPENDYFMVDMGDLADQIADLKGLKEPAAELKKAIGKAVVAHTDGPAAANASGLAAYFPPTSKLRRANYGKVPTARSWERFLSAFYRAAGDVSEGELPTYVDDDRLIEKAPESVKGVKLSSKVEKGTGGNIVDAQLFWGEVDINDSTSVVFYGDRNATVDGDTVKADYDWRHLTISDGETSSPAYSSLTFGPDGKLAKMIIPIMFARGSDQVRGSLQLSVRDDRITVKTFYLMVNDSVAAITPEPGDIFVPLLKHQNLETQEITWITGSDSALSADPGGLKYNYGNMAPASAILLGLGITDLVGNADFMYYGTATPAELN